MSANGDKRNLNWIVDDGDAQQLSRVFPTILLLWYLKMPGRIILINKDLGKVLDQSQ